jgi:two-component system response regulator (stage 0 sporulation protein A)
MNKTHIMPPYKAILADNNRDYLRLLSGFLEETGLFEIQDYAFDGKQAMELTRDFKPHLLVFDLIMPIFDGFAVIEELKQGGYDAQTKFVMTTAVGLDFVMKKAQSHDVDYVFLKPFDKDVFKRRILELMEHKKPRIHALDFNEDHDPETIVTKHIKAIGITANIKGYRYLRDAILLVYNDFDLMSRLTTGLYVMVATKYNSTPQRVERAMRHAIETAWNRGNLDVLEDFFGYTIVEARGKPTNGEFIAMLADKLSTELKHVD